VQGDTLLQAGLNEVACAGPSSTELQVSGQRYLVVSQSSAGTHLQDWGVLRFTEEHHKPQCTTCDRNRGGCPHVVAAGKVGPEKGDKTAELESRFQAFFDGERGCRRLTCRSRVAIPPDIKTSQYAEKYRGTLPPMLRTCHELGNLLSDVPGSLRRERHATCHLLPS
jgi:hypothetical protein